MEEAPRHTGQVSLLLRVGLGGVWVYEGLVGKLLAPNPELLVLLARSPLASGNPLALLRAVGVFEILLGLLLIRGWMIRSVAAAQCGLLAVFTLGIGALAPQLLAFPTGALSKNAALLAAGLCLILIGRGPNAWGSPTWREAALPLILRLGLGFVWVYEGIVPKWLFPSSAGIEIVAGTGLVPLHIPAFLRWLGILETTLGLSVLAGLWVRGLAALQVGLLTAFVLIIGRTSPVYLWDALGSLSKNLGLIGSALALYRIGGGPIALDAWLGRSHTWRQWVLLATLQRTLVVKVAAGEIYGVQGQAATGPDAQGLLQKLQRDATDGAEDLGALIRRHRGRPLPVAGLVRGLAWAIGCVTALIGTRAALRLALRVEERGLAAYARIMGLLPPEEGITARALQAMQGREVQHIRLLRDHLWALRPRGRRRR